MMFDGSKILITGGTGSFGSTVVNSLLKLGVAEVRIFSRDEKKQDDMRRDISDSRCRYIIGDVRDHSSIVKAVSNVDYVFHAAALKQVPSCEFFPDQAILTNVIGAANVIRACVERGVKKLVCLSTDKAVYPINAMGLTKALMEKLVVATGYSEIETQSTICCATRYGNVMASRGSVIPLFIEQIKAGRDITITDPNMTRFLMSLEDSVDLVFHAFRNGAAGDIFVRKAPSCTVSVLVEALVEIFGTGAERIVTIGTRHGEKLYETLVSSEEMRKAQDKEGYYRIPMDTRTLDYTHYVEEGVRGYSDLEAYHSHNTLILSRDKVKEILLSLPFVQRELG